MSAKGKFALVLHSHLPYVISHGKWPHGMDWLSEAACECYIPLLNVFYKLLDEGIKPKVTIDISPILAEQLADESFKLELIDYLNMKIHSAVEDREQFEKEGLTEYASLAAHWEKHFKRTLLDFTEKYHMDLIGAFRRLQEEGAIEIITCGATHGYFPLLSEDISIQAQVKQAVSAHKRHFGVAPKGIWLPECAYRPRYEWQNPIESDKKPYLRKGVDEFLSENGIEFFIVDTHLTRGGKNIGAYIERFEALKQLWKTFEKQYNPSDEIEDRTPYEIYLVSSNPETKKPVAIFTRDPNTTIQVWSGEHGYPGDGNYLEFHKKSFPGGHRYWKITSQKADLADKEIYNVENAMARIYPQADHFRDLIKGVLSDFQNQKSRPGILVSPFDTELFGHWWHEGPMWLYEVYKRIDADPDIEQVTLSEALSETKPTTVIQIPEGSWGQGGFHYIWLNDWTRWTWKHVYDAERKMIELAQKYGDTKDENLQKILKQAARELLLLQASDWQFLISTWSARDYAELRVVRHYEDFIRLYKMADKYGSGEYLDPGEWYFLGETEKRDKVFPDIDVRWWQELEYDV